MTRRDARRYRIIALTWGASTLATLALQSNRSAENVLANMVFCLVIALVVTEIYRRFLPRLRGFSLLPAALLAGLALLTGVALSVLTVVWVILAVAYRNPFERQVWTRLSQVFISGGGWRGIFYAFLLVLAVTFFIELVRRLGAQRIASLLLGRYRNPKEERRVFLLVDLRDSTPLAESLGSVRFSALLRDLFRDITDPIVDTGGEVVGYVGDEAIVSWSEHRGTQDANAVRCFLGIVERLRQRSDEYEALYGVSPKIKGAIHLGPVVITEVGELRTDVAFHGDALNTASRILDECGPLGADLLISGPTMERFPPLPKVRFEPIGAIPLRGKGEPLALVRAVADGPSQPTAP